MHRLYTKSALAIIMMATALGAQTIPTGPNTPVVFVNGYQLNCAGVNFAASFANADTVLQARGISSVFFDNCAIAGKPSLEALGIAFGQFLAGLKYSDGSPVTQVDVVAHSMGGLIVRSYLAGKQDTNPATFAPPANPGIRRLIFLATPQFGTALTTYLGIDKQSQELTIGSQFLFDLNTWNNNTDDLRGVDALAIVGNGGTGLESLKPGFDDGLATLTSASIGFARTGRTRVVPACHSNDSLLTALFLCSSNAPSIAKITDSANLVGQIIVSFLTGTDQWQSLGQAIEVNPLASAAGGLYVSAQDLNGVSQSIASGSVTTQSGTSKLSVNSGQIAYAESLPPGISLALQIATTGSLSIASAANLTATTVLPQFAKPGPVIARVLPAASVTFPLSVAPGQFVAIYGSGLSTSILQAQAPYPMQLGDVQVLVDGVPVPIEYASARQINIVFPDPVSSLSQLTVRNGGGSHTIRLLNAPAVPAIFSLDGSGSGAAAALNGLTGAIVSSGAPLHAGDFVALYLTGLGLTTTRDGLDYARIVPSVTVGGQDCPVTYAGRAPTLDGLDQINCRLPLGIAPGGAVPVVVSSNGRNSNTVTLVVQ